MAVGSIAIAIANAEGIRNLVELPKDLRVKGSLTKSTTVGEAFSSGDRRKHGGNDLRVLFYLFFPAGGIGRYTAKLMPELTSLGAEVEAAVLPEFQWKHELGFDSWAGLRSISHPNPLVRKSRFLIGQVANPLRLAKRVSESSPDVVHICNINHLSYPTWERLFPKRGPLLAATVHDVRRQKGIVCKPFESWQLKRFYRRADLLLVHSDSQKDELCEFASITGDKVCVVPHGPYEYPQPTLSRQEIRAKIGVPNQAYVGLAFGQLRDEKNISGLLRALADCPSDYHLVIAGSDVPRHQSMCFYERLAKDLDVDYRVHTIAGFVPDNQVAELLFASDYLALTYAESFSSQSGVLSSAAQFDLPVLATPTATFAESLQRYRIGQLCEGFSNKAIQNGVVQLRNSATDVCFDEYRVENSWQRNAELTLMAYREHLR